MRISNLPSSCWNEPCLRLIAAAAGDFVKMDSTSLSSKGCFARVVVRVDTMKPLVTGTDVELQGIDLPVLWQQFQYEHIHLLRSRCGRLGHRYLACSLVKSQSHVPGSSSAQVNSTLESNSNLDVNMMDSGFSPPADDDSPVHIPWIHRRWRGPPRQPSRLGVSLEQQSRDLLRDSPRPLPHV